MSRIGESGSRPVRFVGARLMAAVIPGVLVAGLAGVGCASTATATSAAGLNGKQSVCVSGTHGKYARLALLDSDRDLIQVFHLRKGCLTFVVDEDLPAGTYYVRHRAPKGRLTGNVLVSGGSESEDGSQAVSGICCLERHPSLRKVKTRAFDLGPSGFGSVSFASVKKKHH